MRRLGVFICCLLSVAGCERQQQEARPSGLKNMAPPSIQEAVQDGLDAEPNNTFLQAIEVTMTGDTMHWSGSLDAGDVDIWHIKAKAGTVADVLVTPDGDADILVDYAATAQEGERRYYDVAGAGGAELLPNIRLTPQGGYISIRGRHTGEAVGYRLSLARVVSEDGSSVVEAEPNDTTADAHVVTMPNKVEGAVYPSGDVDSWRVPLVTPSVIQFTMPDGVYEVAIERQNQVIWSEVSRHAQVLKSVVLSPDYREVTVRIKSLEAVREHRKYGFEVAALEKVPDELEPNHTIETAQKIQGMSQSLEFSLADSADVDIFQVLLEPGHVYSARLVGPEPGQARIQVLSASGISRGDILGDGQAVCDASIEGNAGIWLKVTPGVGVMAWPLGYRIVMDSVPLEQSEREPNQQMAQAQEIAPGTMVQGHIFPAGDVDMYKIVLPEYAGVEGPVGTLSVDVEGGYVAQLRLMLQDSAGYEISQARNAQYSRPVHLAFDAPNGVYMLAVSGAGDGCVKPYRLKVSFNPNEAAVAAIAAAAAAAAAGIPSSDGVAVEAAPSAVAVPEANDGVQAAEALKGVWVEQKAEQGEGVVELPSEALPEDIPLDALIQAAQGESGLGELPLKDSPEHEKLVDGDAGEGSVNRLQNLAVPSEDEDAF